MTSLFLLGLRYYVGNPPALLPRRLRIGGRTRKKFVERCSFGDLDHANDGFFPGYFDSRAEMSVRVWKGGFLAETL